MTTPRPPHPMSIAALRKEVGALRDEFRETRDDFRQLVVSLEPFIARIPEHLLLAAPLDGQAPAHLYQQIESLIPTPSGESTPLVSPPGFSWYAIYASPWGVDDAGAVILDVDVLGTFYNDKALFFIWTLRYHAPDVQPQILRARHDTQHGAAGVADGGHWGVRFGADGVFVQSAPGWHDPVVAQLAAIRGQMAGLATRLALLDGGGK